MSAIAVVVTGGYFAYDYYDSHKAKPKPPTTAKAPGSSAGTASDGSQGGSDQGSEAGSQRGSQAGSQRGSQAGSEDGSQAGSGDEPGAHKSVEVAMPDLTGKTADEAKALLTGLGFKEDALDLPADKACFYEDERNPVPVDTICNQERGVGTKVMTDQKIRVVIEHDTWEHGGVHAGNEWHRMPDLSGMSLTAAQQLLRDKGFADDEFEITEPRGNCRKGIVCSQHPKADGRKYVNRKGELGVGQ